MPKRTDIDKIMIIGSGPIIIGQACEFDYSGTQACKALRSLGYSVVLVNSNPATIMTDTDTADAVYIEPLNMHRLTKIIEKERPQAILPNLGGQSALNLTSELAKGGVLEHYNVEVIGVQLDAIERGEDRDEFKRVMNSLGVEMAKSQVAYSVDEAVEIAAELGYPCVLRPAYTMGGTGGGLVYNIDELRTVVQRGLDASPVHEVLVEESILGWEELELEVVRDAAGNKITVCYIENIDPLGVHTGDSFCAAPMITISETVQKRLQQKSYEIMDAVGVIGGCNVQWAHDPESDRDIIIEINPRTSRSSALASKATGFPIAYISALLACGLNLSDITCGKHGTLDRYVPSGDYIVLKFARWAFEKFKGVEDKLGTQMRAVGEVMSIGKTYKEALQKAIRSLEKGRFGLGCVKDFASKDKEELLNLLATPSSERHFIMYEALRKGATIDEIYELTKIKHYFLEQMHQLVEEEEALRSFAAVHNNHALKQLDANFLITLKRDGFSDRYLSQILNCSEQALRQYRLSIGCKEQWEGIHVSSTQNSAYYFSTYNEPGNALMKKPAAKEGSLGKIMILGGGPNRIGQGIEFDYCCVHATQALKKLGFETIIVNCNPETVSTDYDTSDKLYFEPLCTEEVLAIYEEEQPLGVIAQFGGQTPLTIARELEEAGITILGTSPTIIDMAEDRDQFRAMMDKLDIPMPEAGMAVTCDEALEIAHDIGYPVMVRPSYVLGGRGMEIVYDDANLRDYMTAAIGVTPDRPILIDRFLNNAMECEADAICDGTHAFVPAVMEHVELAGIHSGDSACVLPSVNITPRHLNIIKDYTRKIAEEMHVCGLMNIQYAIENGRVFVIEANPRASRTIPLVSKVCGINMVHIATEVVAAPLTGQASPVPQLKEAIYSYAGVKEAVFPFNMFPEVDPVLGPEMRSTGEVLGLAASFGEAYFKAQEATQAPLPTHGTVFISVSNHDKGELIEMGKLFKKAGFEIIATRGTRDALVAEGIEATLTLKANQGRPSVLDLIANGGIDIMVNTPSAKRSSIAQGTRMRHAAIKAHIPYMTTLAAGLASAEGILAVQAAQSEGSQNVPKSLQELHSSLQ